MAAGEIIGGLMSIPLAGINNMMGSSAQRQARAENYMYGEMAAANAYQRQRALYNDFYSPEALLRQYQKAGLSPSLMFGGTPGQGGQMAPQGGGAQGLGALAYPASIGEAAQAAALFAQAEKTKAETKTIEGENPRGWAEIANIHADTLNKNQQATLAGAEAAGIELDNYVKDNTKEASIYQICELADKAGYEAQTAYEIMLQNNLLTQYNQETYEDQVKLKKKEVEALAQSISESKSAERLNDQQRRKLYNDILQGWEQIDINWRSLDIEKQSVDNYKEWIDGQLDALREQLQLKWQDLDLRKLEMIIGACTETIKAISFGAMAYSSYAGGRAAGAGAASTTKALKTTNRGGHALNPKDKVPVYKQNIYPN